MAIAIHRKFVNGSIADSYSTSAVWGSENVGGLVGYINGDNIPTVTAQGLSGVRIILADWSGIIM